jgi:predicted transcriptional regulator
MPTKKKTVSVRLDPKLAKRLEAMARTSRRSVSWQINRLVEDNIDYLEYAVNAINEGLEDIRAGRTHDAKDVLNEMLETMKQKERPRARRAG